MDKSVRYSISIVVTISFGSIHEVFENTPKINFIFYTFKDDSTPEGKYEKILGICKKYLHFICGIHFPHFIGHIICEALRIYRKYVNVFPKGKGKQIIIYIFETKYVNLSYLSHILRADILLKPQIWIMFNQPQPIDSK